MQLCRPLGLAVICSLTGILFSIAACSNSSSNPSYVLGYKFGHRADVQAQFDQALLGTSQSPTSFAKPWCKQVPGPALGGPSVGPNYSQWVKGCSTGLLSH
jgi:hypothetical protein